MQDMSIEERISGLNTQGLEFPVEDDRDNFDIAGPKHAAALQFSDLHFDEINPDYYAFSAANLANAIRHWSDKPKDRNLVGKILREAMKKVEVAFYQRGNESHFGRGRILEEMAAASMYGAKQAGSVPILDGGMIDIRNSRSLYQQALEIPNREIVSVSFIQDKISRSYGIESRLVLEIGLRKIEHEKDPSCH